jgi:hypothetical protein
VAEEFSVWGDDSDVESGDEDEDLFLVVVSSYADVVEASVVAEGDGSGLIDSVLADSDVVGGDGLVLGSCFLAGLVCVVEGGVFGAVGSGVVVVVGEPVDLGLELSDGFWGWLAGEMFFEGLVESFDFPAGLGVVGAGVFGFDAEGEECGFEALLTSEGWPCWPLRRNGVLPVSAHSVGSFIERSEHTGDDPLDQLLIVLPY